jgi:hypothetical protein
MIGKEGVKHLLDRTSVMCLEPVFISDVFDHRKRDQRNRVVQENFAASGGDRSRLC